MCEDVIGADVSISLGTLGAMFRFPTAKPPKLSTPRNPPTGTPLGL